MSASSGSRGGPTAAPPVRRSRLSPFARYALLRLTLIPAQVLFVLWLLYLTIGIPAYLHPALGVAPSGIGTAQFFTGFGSMVAQIFTGNWGVATGMRFPLPWFQLYVDFLPTSLQIAVFALPLAALLAYVLAFSIGWRSRAATDAPTRLSIIGVGLVPVVVLGLAIEFLLFFSFYAAFGDIPGNGIIPSPAWFPGGFPPSWVLDGWITRPTGFPLLDGALHQDWGFEAVTFVKTLIQALGVALIYVTVFLRHARSVVTTASRGAHVDAGRARGLSEATLQRHARREVLPGFLLLFALTIPAYLATQFAVEAIFNDPGIGYLTLTILTTGEVSGFVALEGMIFLLAVLVIVSVYAIDLFVARIDPRGAVAR